MKKIIMGVLLILAGVLIALNKLDILSINIFFKGWWTLFLIIPSVIDLINKKGDSTLSIIILLVGVTMLLTTREIISPDIISALFIPVILVIVGISIIIGYISKPNITLKDIKHTKEGTITSVFSDNKTILTSEDKFKQMKLESVFGGITLDLNDATLVKESYIEGISIFSSITVVVPKDVNVVIKSNNIFGSVTTKIRNSSNNKKTLYVDGTTLFGGIEIK